MANVFDVGAYILRELGPMERHKLQKLVYYAQAWSLTLRGDPLFTDPIEAWRDGPVVRRLYELDAGQWAPVTSVRFGNADDLSSSERDLVEAVLAVYAEEDAEALIARTHREKPWKQARRGLSEEARSNNPISPDSMVAFFSRCSERRAIDMAFRKLTGAKFLGLSGPRAHGASDESVRLAREALQQRARLGSEDSETWVQKMTQELAGADD